MDLEVVGGAGGVADLVAGAESRGFIFGTALAQTLSAGFVPIRKAGKLPRATRGLTYSLEYGTDRVEIHADAIKPGQKILIVDDLLATAVHAVEDAMVADMTVTPKWLDEGLAVTIEKMLGNLPAAPGEGDVSQLWTPFSGAKPLTMWTELAELHQGQWNPDAIQNFWAGTARRAPPAAP